MYWYSAGMFGVRIRERSQTFVSGKLKKSFETILNLSSGQEVDRLVKKTTDQKLLKRFIWPYAQNDSVIHDSYTCKIKRLRGTVMRPFPTRRLHGKFNFVGSNGGNITLKQDGPCPEECRPMNHKEWVVC